MNKFKITRGVIALAVATVAIVACSKEKTPQKETTTTLQPVESRDYTLAELAEALSWEDGKAFLENQPVKNYSVLCENLLNDCAFAEKEADLPFIISWVLKVPNGNCNLEMPGSCLVIRKKDESSVQANAVGYYEGGKLIIVPTTEENGFTADGYLVVGAPIEVQNDTIVILEGIYAAYYDEEVGLYTAVAVDYR